MLKSTALLAIFALAAPGFAQTLTLTPASPQPEAGSLKQGLAVDYAYYSARSLDEAKGKLDVGSRNGKRLEANQLQKDCFAQE